MHITAVCPRCQSQYQVDPGLRGKRMRCVNSICRAVFEVGEAAPASAPEKGETPTPPPTVTDPASASVADFVPVLPAEAVGAEAAAPPQVKQPKPVRDKQPAPPLPRQRPVPPRREAEADVPDDFPVDAPTTPAAASTPGAAEEKPVGTWEAPPVRQSHAGPSVPPAVVVAPPQRVRRRSVWMIVGMLTVLGGGLALGLWLIGGRRAEVEQERYQAALARYENYEFADAVMLLQQLQRDYPKSDQSQQYRFLAEWSDVRSAVHAPHEDPVELLHAVERMNQFLSMHRNEPLLKQWHGDIWQSLHRLATDLVDAAKRQQDPAFLTVAERAWKEASKYQPPSEVSVADAGRQFKEAMRQVETGIARAEERRRLSALLQAWTAEASAQRLRQAKRLVQAAALQDDAEFKDLLRQLTDAHREQIVFHPVAAEEPPPVRDDERFTSVALLPALGKAEKAAVPAGVVLALARGVLYGLDAQTGAFVWARRVGVDTTELPLRITTGDASGDRLFVCSSDSRSLLAVETGTGKVLWQQSLSGVCLSRPLLVNDRLLVPTLANRIEEIDSATGRLRGAWHLDQPVAHSGVHQPDTSLVYFVGEADCVYALDVAAGLCQGILYTDHGAGDVLTQPLVWNEPTTDPAASKGKSLSGWLGLIRTHPPHGTAIQAWALPWSSPTAPPLTPVAPLSGRAWFPPFQTIGKVALATDAGHLALLGRRLPGNRDPLLFPWLEPFPRIGSGQAHGRAQIVHADDDSYWVLAQGRLQRLQPTFSDETGPGMMSRWLDPPNLGSPAHAPQVRQQPDGSVVTYTVSYLPDRAASVISAVEGNSGRVLWQRLLGTTPLHTPLAWGKHLVLHDEHGLLKIDPATLTAGSGWHSAGAWLHESGAARAGAMVQHGDDLLHFTWTDKALSWRRFLKDSDKPRDASATLPAAPTGPPAVGQEVAVLALANGISTLVSLSDGMAAAGPDWRGVGVEETAPAYVAHLGDNWFALTDGNRGLDLVHWPEPKKWAKKGSVQLTDRIVAAPAVLTGAAGGTLRIAVADASDTVTLLQGTALQPQRRWTPGGKITAGPFVLGKHIAVICEKRRIVWLDPETAEPVWQYACAASIAGPPRLLDGKLIVADVSGAITMIDISNGQVDDQPFVFRANVAPATAPLPLEQGRLLVPLADGTLALVNRDAAKTSPPPDDKSNGATGSR